MIILTTQNLTAYCDATSTSAPSWQASYADHIPEVSFTEGNSCGVLTDTTAVTIVDVPIFGTKRAVKTISFCNLDSVTQTFTVLLDDGVTQTTLFVKTIPPNENLIIDTEIYPQINVQGPTGIQGVTGLIGGTGIQGQTGISLGETGIQGLTGLVGETGIAGVTGVGQTGIQGETGICGQTGIEGQTGIRGPTGIQGETGICGQTGIEGQTGIQGLTGLQNFIDHADYPGFTQPAILLWNEDDEALFVAGLTGINKWVMISAGAKSGAQGVTGIYGGGTGLQGVTGIYGQTGIQGDTGIDGQTGILGPQGLPGNVFSYQNGRYPTVDYKGTFHAWARSDSPNGRGLNTRIFVECDASGSTQCPSFLKFNFDSVSTPTNTITSAVLGLTAWSVQSNPEIPFHIYQCKRDWTSNYDGTYFGTTWNKYDGINAWTDPGCQDTTYDRGSDLLGDVNVIKDSPVPVYFETALNTAAVSLINDWISDKSANNGFVIQHYNELPWSALTIYTSSNTNVNYRPILKLYTQEQGSTGVQGLSGIRGVTGIQGFTGLYRQGVTGLSLNVIGGTGILGETGQTGIRGPTGIQGLTGPQGLQGVTGLRGLTGMALGSTGIAGFTGAYGGPPGVTGLDGQTGIQGVTGLALGSTGYGECYVSTPASTGLATQNVYYLLAGTTTGGTYLQDFTHASPGRLTYTGGDTRKFLVTGSIGAAQVTSSSETYTVRIAKNGTTIAASTCGIYCYPVSNRPGFVCQTVVELATNDFIEMYAACISRGTTAIVANFGNLIAHSV